MKRFLVAVLAGIMVFSLGACDENSDSSDNRKLLDRPNLTDELNELLGIGKESESDELKNFSFAMSGIEFSIPSTFEKQDGSTEDNASFIDIEYLSNQPMKVLSFVDEQKSFSKEEFDRLKSIMFDKYTENAEEILYSEDILVSGLPGKSFAFITTNSNNVKVSVYVTFIYNTNNNKILDVMLLSPDLEDHSKEYNQIIESAKVASQDIQDNNSNENTFSIGGTEFSIPAYFEQQPENISQNTSITDFEIHEGNATLVRLRIAAEDVNISQNEFDNSKDTISSNIAGTNKVLNAHETTLAGLSGRSFSYTTSNENANNLIVHVTFAYNIAEKKLVSVLIIASENLIDKYMEDYDTIIETAKLVSQDAPSDDAQSDKSVYYSTNDRETAKKGNSGVFAYRSRGGTYYNYWIIDFDEGYVYSFSEGNDNSLCDRLKIESGDLNKRVIITYHDGGDVWSYGLHFKWKNQPDHLILEDNDHFEWDFYETSLSEALEIRDRKTIVDY